MGTALLTFPFMAAVQNVCSRLGLISGTGLAGILEEHYPRWVLYPAVALVFVANVVNIGTALGWIVTIAMFAALVGLALTSFGS